MRTYVFYALMAAAAFIRWKWKLVDPNTHRPKDSNDENRVGYALLSFVFIGVVIFVFSGGFGLPD